MTKGSGIDHIALFVGVAANRRVDAASLLVDGVTTRTVLPIDLGPPTGLRPLIGSASLGQLGIRAIVLEVSR